MGKRLTDGLIRKLSTDRHSIVIYDAPNGSRSDFVSGFGVRCTHAGAKSFVLNYRTKDGTERRYTIGRWPEWTLVAARDEAKELQAQIAKGRDPVREGKELRQRRRSLTSPRDLGKSICRRCGRRPAATMPAFTR
jgi:hypothetical protein